MLPETSKTYLDQCKIQGMDFNEVASQLTKTGWSPEQIELARKYYLPGIDAPAITAVSPAVIPAAPEEKKENNRLKIGLFVLFGLIFLLAATGVPAYFVATEKLNIGSEAFKSAVTSLVFSIPFIPKTPKFILLAAVDAHKKLSKNSFDVSMSSQSDNFKSLIGGNSLDAQLKGYADFSDTKNPRFSLTLNVTKDFSAQARKNDKMVYLKIDKLPLAAVAFLGMDPDKLNNLLNNWVALDTSPLETEARKNLDLLNKPTSAPDAELVNFLTKLANEDILPYIKVTTEKLDQSATYKLVFAPNVQTLDKIGDEIRQEAIDRAQKSNPDLKITNTDTQMKSEKLSDYVKNPDIRVWIDNNNYYLRKATVTLTINPGSSTGTSSILSGLPIPTSVSSPITLSMALVMSDFGKTVPIETPANYLTPEEFYKKFIDLSPTMQGLTASSQNARTEADLRNVMSAAELYRSDNNDVMPTSLAKLQPHYLVKIPNGAVIKLNKAKTKALIYIKDSAGVFWGMDTESLEIKNMTQAEINAF